MKNGRMEDAESVAGMFAIEKDIKKVSLPDVKIGKNSLSELKNYLPFSSFHFPILVLIWCSKLRCVDLYSPLFFSTLSYVYSILATLLEILPVIIGTVLCIALVDGIGRKTMQALGFGFAGASLFTFSLISYKGTPSFFYLFIAFALMYLFHNIGPTNTTYLYPVEIFPIRIRANAMGIATATSRIGAIVGVFVFPITISTLNVSLSLIFFAIFEFLGLSLTSLLAPETKNVPIE